MSEASPQGPSAAAARLSRMLLERSTPNGGFAAVPGGPPDAESTALAAIALRAAEPTGAALDWLRERQRSDGSWPRTDDVALPSWAGAWAALALAQRGRDREAVERAGRWLVAREGRRPGVWVRFLSRVSGEDAKVEQDAMLRGWPWHPDAIAWVEPTASALLALRAVTARVPVAGAETRIDEGERLLLDRVCVDGGWNYGNRRVLDVVLPPYPDTTALALLALDGRRGQSAIDESLGALERLLDERASGLSLALAALAFERHGRDATALRDRVVGMAAPAVPPRETRSLAFMLLALTGGIEQLGVEA